MGAHFWTWLYFPKPTRYQLDSYYTPCPNKSSELDTVTGNQEVNTKIVKYDPSSLKRLEPTLKCYTQGQNINNKIILLGNGWNFSSKIY